MGDELHYRPPWDMKKEDRQVLNEWSSNQFKKELAEQDKKIAEAKADALAVWALADYMLPADIKEFGIRNKIPELGKEIWRDGFIAGWRAALKDSFMPSGAPFGKKE